MHPVTLETKRGIHSVDAIEESVLGSRVMAPRVGICEEVTIDWWGIDEEMVV